MDNPKFGPAGSISGFSSIHVTNEESVADPRLPAAPISLSGLIERFAQLRRDLDPEHLQSLLEKIESHLYASGAVHGLTVDDISEAVILDLAELFLPGTLPYGPASLSVSGELATLLPELSVVRTGTIWATNRAGVLEEVAANTLAVDYGVDGTPLMPIFPGRTNYFTRSVSTAALAYAPDDGTARLRAVGGVSLAASDGSIKNPDGTDDVVICTDSGTDDVHGVKMASVQANALVTVANVTSAFVLPLGARYITLRLVDDAASLDVSTHYATFDTHFDVFVDEGAGIIAAYAHKSPNGCYRLGLEYALAGTTSIGMEVLGHHVLEDISFDGTASQALFAISNLSHTYGSGLAPFIKTEGATASSGATSITIAGGDTINPEEGIFHIEWVGYHNTAKSTGVLRGTNLLKIDTDKVLSLTNTGVTVSFGETSADGYYANNSQAAHAVSYAPLKLVHKSLGAAAETVPAVIAPFGGSLNIVIGPAPGYLRSFSAYQTSDRGRVVNYLIGEAE